MNPKTFIFSALVILSLLSNSPKLILAQINTPCTSTMLSSVSGCMSFLTGSSGGNSPTSACCESLKSLTGTGMDCLCLIVTASVPFTLPINRTLAISLPRACGMPGVPVQCKASAAPLPAPGPMFLGPTTSPTDTQTPEGSPSFGPASSPTNSFNPGQDQDIPESTNREDPGVITPPSASLPSSSHSLKLSILLFTFAFEIFYV